MRLHLFHQDACALPDCLARFPTACVAFCFSLLCDSWQPGATAYVEFKEPHKCLEVQIWDSVSAHKSSTWARTHEPHTRVLKYQGAQRQAYPKWWVTQRPLGTSSTYLRKFTKVLSEVLLDIRIVEKNVAGDGLSHDLTTQIHLVSHPPGPPGKQGFVLCVCVCVCACACTRAQDVCVCARYVWAPR